MTWVCLNADGKDPIRRERWRYRRKRTMDNKVSKTMGRSGTRVWVERLTSCRRTTSSIIIAGKRLEEDWARQVLCGMFNPSTRWLFIITLWHIRGWGWDKEKWEIWGERKFDTVTAEDKNVEMTREHVRWQGNVATHLMLVTWTCKVPFGPPMRFPSAELSCLLWCRLWWRNG